MLGSQATPASRWLWPRGGGQRLGSGRWLRQQWGGPSLIPEGALGCSRLPFLGLAASLLPGTGSWLFLPRAGACVSAGAGGALAPGQCWQLPAWTPARARGLRAVTGARELTAAG